MNIKKIAIISTVLFIIGCSTDNNKPNTVELTPSNNIEFLAFGDGGYHMDYPKGKELKNPLNKAQLILKERTDWIEDGRPIEEFSHYPIYVHPDTGRATEQSGAKAVGLAMANLCKQRNCQFGLQLGDNIYPDGADANDGKNDQKRMDDLILSPLLPLFKQEPNLMVYSALGNHDWKSSRKGVSLQTQWMKDQPNFHLEKRGYYSYKVGIKGNDVEFFVLDTNMLLSGQTFYDIPLASNGSEQTLKQAQKNGEGELEEHDAHEWPIDNEDQKQLTWLEQGLKNSTAKWKIVYGHHILWSIGGTKYSEGHVLRKLLMPSLCKYSDAYIAGHEHDLELITDNCENYLDDNQTKELPLIISGAASKMRGKHTPFAEYQAKAYPEYQLLWSKSLIWGFAHLSIDNDKDTLNVEFFTTPTDESGEVVSEYKHSFKKNKH